MAYGQKYRNYPFADRFGQWPVDERQEGIRRLIEEFENNPQYRERTLAMMTDPNVMEAMRGVRPGSDYGGSSRMPMYHPDLMVPPGSIPRGEGESPPMHATPDELEQYGDITPGAGSPYSRPLPGENVPLVGPGSEREDIENTKRLRMQELIDRLHEADEEDYKGY